MRAVASLTRKASLLQHIQITGQKTWWLQTPAGLRRHKIFPVRLQRYVGVTSRLLTVFCAQMGHPSARQLQESSTHLGDFEAMKVVTSPGDVLCLPAYWLHEVRTTAAAGSVSVNFWKQSETQAGIYGRPHLFFDVSLRCPFLPSNSH